LKLVAAGDKHVFYAFGKDFYANDTHAVDIDSPTAAGCHPTDVGHYRIARHYSAILPGWMRLMSPRHTNAENAEAVQIEHRIQQQQHQQQQHQHQHPSNGVTALDNVMATITPRVGNRTVAAGEDAGAAGSASNYSWTKAEALGACGLPSSAVLLLLEP
jgi:hypothetical protein